MIILGIDPGSAKTGVGVLEIIGNTKKILFCDTIASNLKNEFHFRIKEIYDGVEYLIKKYSPKRFAIETAFYGKNVQSALKLGQVRGALLVLAANYNLTITEFSPKEIKRAVTGSGNAEKSQVAFMIKKLLNCSDFPSSDASDAIAIALCDSFYSSNPIQKNKKGASTWKEYVKENSDKVIIM